MSVRSGDVRVEVDVYLGLTSLTNRANCIVMAAKAPLCNGKITNSELAWVPGVRRGVHVRARHTPVKGG